MSITLTIIAKKLMVTLIIKVTVAMISMIARIRITSYNNRKTKNNNNNSNNTAFQVTIKRQTISNEETLTLK